MRLNSVFSWFLNGPSPMKWPNERSQGKEYSEWEELTCETEIEPFRCART